MSTDNGKGHRPHASGYMPLRVYEQLEACGIRLEAKQKVND
jgi:hypothetical protein